MGYPTKRVKRRAHNCVISRWKKLVLTGCEGYRVGTFFGTYHNYRIVGPDSTVLSESRNESTAIHKAADAMGID